MVNHSSESSLLGDVKSKQHFHPILIELKQSVLRKSIEVFSQVEDGVLRYLGRLCVPYLDDLRGKFFDEARSLRYSII